MDDRPTALDLLRAVGDFLEQDLIPAVADRRLRYEILIAVNALRIAQRELDGRERRLRAELDALSDLLGLPRAPVTEDPAALRQRVLEANRELGNRIRQGLADDGPWRERVLRHLEAVAEDKLRITDPGEIETSRAEGGERRP